MGSSSRGSPYFSLGGIARSLQAVRGAKEEQHCNKGRRAVWKGALLVIPFLFRHVIRDLRPPEAQRVSAYYSATVIARCRSKPRDLFTGSYYDAECVTVAWHECSPRSSERSETGAVRLSKASRELLAARHIHV